MQKKDDVQNLDILEISSNTSMVPWFAPYEDKDQEDYLHDGD
jgi:hypothetical protein